MPDVHLFLLIHGLWGESFASSLPSPPPSASMPPSFLHFPKAEEAKLTLGHPVHLAEAKAELEAAWHTRATSGADTPSTPDVHDPDTPTPCLTPSVSSYDSDDTMVNSYNFTPHGHDLVVVVAEGMTSTLTYDGVDVCASRVAWEVSPSPPTPSRPARRMKTGELIPG